MSMSEMSMFNFDLTCDVIGDLRVKFYQIRLSLTCLAGLSKAASILKIDPVVSEIGGVL